MLPQCQDRHSRHPSRDLSRGLATVRATYNASNKRAVAERQRGEPRQAIGLAWGKGIADRSPLESHLAPARSMEGGGSRLALAVQTVQRSAHRPAACRGAKPRRPAAGAGNLVKSIEVQTAAGNASSVPG